MKKIIQENILKNILLLIILGLSYNPIQDFILNNQKLLGDNALAGDFLVAVSILAVTACFGNFAFTYEKTKEKKQLNRLLAHSTTGLLMLLIGIALIMTSALGKILIGNFPALNISLLILYVASVLYDFWDLEKIKL